MTDAGEPESFAQAMEDKCKSQWFKVMYDEMQSHHENHIFELVRLSPVAAVKPSVDSSPDELRYIKRLLMTCNVVAFCSESWNPYVSICVIGRFLWSSIQASNGFGFAILGLFEL
ncbi:hypothetical protein AKJ16_DCAP12408 [Drosera capensis]